MNWDQTLQYYNNTHRLPGSSNFNLNYGLPNNMTNEQFYNLNSIMKNTYPNNVYNQGYISYNRPAPVQGVVSTIPSISTIPTVSTLPYIQTVVNPPTYSYGSPSYLPNYHGHSHGNSHGHLHGHSHGHSHIMSNGHTYTIPNYSNLHHHHLSGSNTHDTDHIHTNHLHTSHDLIAHTITVEDKINVGYTVTSPLFIGNLFGKASRADKLAKSVKICDKEFDGTDDIELDTSCLTEGDNKFYTETRALNSIKNNVTTKFIQDLHFNSTNADILPKVNYATIDNDNINLNTLWEGVTLNQVDVNVVLKQNDKILVKNQFDRSKNGVYIINVSGTAASRVDYFKKDITLNTDVLIYIENDIGIDKLNLSDKSTTNVWWCAKGTKINENDDIIFYQYISTEQLLYKLFKN